ncbi:MAG: LamG-like jellyroll fold domain-containing protein [Candidatus Saccharimonadales bacterium]
MVNEWATTRDIRRSGFTIIELLVAIVIIGVLATITIVSYAGVSQKATIASLQSNLTDISKQLKLDQILNSGYPADLDGISASTDTNYQYFHDNSATPQTFCVTAISNGQRYMTTNDSAPTQGDCLNYGLVLDYDAGNSISYPGMGTTWTDLSSLNNTGTLMNGVGYSGADGGGALTFDGVNDYVDMGNDTSIKNFIDKISVTAWVRYTAYGGGGQSYSVVTTKGSPWTWLLENYNNKIRFRVTAGGVDSNASDSAIHSLNTWYYFAGTYDGTSIKIYKNGVQVGTTARTGNLAINNITAKVGTYTGTSYNLTGSIATISVYNRALSGTEILQNFNNTKTRYGL